ncbi:MAG: hypothetical protein ACI4EX_06090 [Lachnospiraceae bacterium]
MMRCTVQKGKLSLQKNWCIYLTVNIVFLLPVFLLTQFSGVQNVFGAFLDKIPESIGMLFLIYWIPVILYFVICLPYLHFAVEFGFVIFAVYRLIKEKNLKIFVLTLILTALSVALNVHWLMHGRPYTVL